MDNRYGAFFRPEVIAEPTGNGPLDGRCFAVKEAFSVAGYVPAAGSPDWLRTHHPAMDHADAIKPLLRAGARLTGTANTDELMYNLTGENAHYGTPVNPRASERIPGGSSSGSAVAVAAGSVDFALGTDTGGSVRVPSACCGIWGIRTSHGLVSTGGVVALAPSFDTVGWMADDADTLATVGEVLLNDACRSHVPSSSTGFTRIVTLRDSQSLADAPSLAAVQQLIQAWSLDVTASSVSQIVESSPEQMERALTVIQGWEVQTTHKAWIEQTRPQFGENVAARFAWALQLREEEVLPWMALRDKVRTDLREFLADSALIVMPTMTGLPPNRDEPTSRLTDWRTRTLQCTCTAGLAGLPQVTIPCRTDAGDYYSVSFIAGYGMDLKLLRWVQAHATKRPN